MYSRRAAAIAAAQSNANAASGNNASFPEPQHENGPGNAPPSVPQSVVDMGSFRPILLKKYKEKFRIQLPSEDPNAPPSSHTSLHSNIELTSDEFTPTIFDDTAEMLEDEEYPLGSSKLEELVNACSKHWLQYEINEKDVLPWFVYTIRNRDKILKLKPPSSTNRTA